MNFGGCGCAWMSELVGQQFVVAGEGWGGAEGGGCAGLDGNLL